MKKVWKIIGIIAGVLIALAGGLLAWLAWEGSPKEIVAVADEFKPGSSWKLVDEQVIPPRNYCIDVHCPSVHRTWKTSELISLKMLKEHLRISSWDMDVRGDCVPDPRSSGNQSVCYADGNRKGYNTSLYIESDAEKLVSTVTLNIDKK